MDKEQSREIIMENYLHPQNRDLPHDGYDAVNTRNESCIDNINLYIKWNEDVLEDIVFDGEACAVSISSTSIMIKNLIGKKAGEALEYINSQNMTMAAISDIVQVIIAAISDTDVEFDQEEESPKK